MGIVFAIINGKIVDTIVYSWNFELREFKKKYPDAILIDNDDNVITLD